MLEQRSGRRAGGGGAGGGRSGGADLPWLLWMAGFLCLPASYVGIVYGVAIPQNPPERGADLNFCAVVFLVSVAIGVGCHFYFALVLFSSPKLASGFRSGVACAVMGTGAYIGLGHLWRFPTPMGYTLFALINVPVCFLLEIHNAFGLRAAFSPRVRRKLLVPALLALLPIVFVLVFAMYRVAFSWLSATEQTYVVPLWPLIKIAFKMGASRLVELI